MNQPFATVVAVSIASGDGLYYATSDDVFGLNLAAPDRDALLRDVPKAIELLYRENFGVRVQAKPFADVEAFPRPIVRDGAFVVEAAGATVAA